MCSLTFHTQRAKEEQTRTNKTKESLFFGGIKKPFDKVHILPAMCFLKNENKLLEMCSHYMRFNSYGWLLRCKSHANNTL